MVNSYMFTWKKLCTTSFESFVRKVWKVPEEIRWKWSQSNGWLVPLEYCQNSLLDVCALIFALDSPQTGNSEWIHHLSNISVCWTFSSTRTAVLSFLWLLTAGSPRSENALCSWLVHAECVWCVATLDIACLDSVHSTCRECWFSLEGLHFCCLHQEISAGNITSLT